MRQMTDSRVELCREKGSWDAFVNGSPQGNVFCSTAFLDALPAEYDLVTLLENGEIVLGAVVLRRGAEVLRAPHPMTMYQGLLCARSYGEMPLHRRPRWLLDRVNLLLAWLASRSDRISFCLSHAFDDLRPLQWFHYHEPELGVFDITLRYTGLLSLDFPDFESYLGRIRGVRRQEYRKAAAGGFTVAASSDLRLLNELHGLTLQRQGLCRDEAEQRLLLSIAAAALEKGFGELLVCRDSEQRPAAATLFLYDQRYGYYLIGANDPGYRKSGAGTFLLLENIRRCHERGLAGVDFVGINSPDRGDFKTSFNAKVVPYHHLDYAKPSERSSGTA